MKLLRISEWTIERAVRTSIVVISSAAVLIMASVSWKLARNASDETLRELTDISTAAAQARLGDTVKKQVNEFQQIAASTVIGTALSDSSGREGYLAPFLDQRTQASGMNFALYDYRGRLLIRTGRPQEGVGETFMAGEPTGAPLRDIDFRVSKDWIEIEAPIRFFADKKPIGFLVGWIDPTLLAADTVAAASKIYSVNVRFYITSAFAPQPQHMQIIDTPRATLAAQVELTAQTSFIDEMLRKLTLVGALAMLAVLLASMVVARWMAKIISAPIGELTQAVAKLRSGEKAAPPMTDMPVEVETLSAALFLAFEERTEALQKVQSLAHFDGVTGALSRAYFDHRARNLMQISMRAHEPSTLLYIDLDRFKEINDAYGHDAGDQILQAVVTRARSRLRAVDLIGRRGGDEFVLLLPQMSRRNDIAALAQNLALLITGPIEVSEGVTVQISVSMGAATFPDDADKYDALVTCADRAMYEAKKAGRGRLCFTKGEMVELATIEWDMRTGAA